jgi:ATP-dependent Lhr-like helicase
LRAIRQKSLARLRHEVEPVEQDALARFYLEWQAVKQHEVSGGVVSGGATPGPARNALTKRLPRTSSARAALLGIIEQLQDVPIPASVLETQVLPARLPNYSSIELDELFSSGEVVWVGREAIGQHDGRISLYLTDHLPLFLKAATPTTGTGWGSEIDSPRAKILTYLSQRGASFYPAILQAVGGFPGDVLNALWDLVWAGEVTNDTLQPLRSYMNPKRLGILPKGPQPGHRKIVVRGFTPASRLSGVSPARSAPAEASGRWSLVSSLAWSDATATERITAHAQQLLTTYGVVTREGVQALGVEGGFSAVYPILKAMEEAGRIRRGYFVAGLGATQFALPGAVDRLRAVREPADELRYAFLAATDPANPYGSTVPWPERPEGRRPARAAGASVLLLNGILAAWLSKSERDLLTFTDCFEVREESEMCRQIAEALAAEVDSGRRRNFLIETVDGMPADRSQLAGPFKEAGFVDTRKGLIKRPQS